MPAGRRNRPEFFYRLKKRRRIGGCRWHGPDRGHGGPLGDVDHPLRVAHFGVGDAWQTDNPAATAPAGTLVFVAPAARGGGREREERLRAGNGALFARRLDRQADRRLDRGPNKSWEEAN